MIVTKQIVFLSLVSITIGGTLWRVGKRTLARGKCSEATIVKNVFCPNDLTLMQKAYGIEDDESGTFYPVIQFKTDNNQVITKQLTIGFNPPMSVGKKLTVLYNPEDPNVIVTYPRFQLEVIPKILISFGLVGLIIVVLDIFGIISVIPN